MSEVEVVIAVLLVSLPGAGSSRLVLSGAKARGPVGSGHRGSAAVRGRTRPGVPPGDARGMGGPARDRPSGCPPDVRRPRPRGAGTGPVVQRLGPGGSEVHDGVVDLVVGLGVARVVDRAVAAAVARVVDVDVGLGVARVV